MKEIFVSSIEDMLENHRCSKCGGVLPGIYTFKEESEPIVLDGWFVIKRTKFMIPIARVGPCDCEEAIK